MDTQSSHEIRMLKEDFIIHDLIQTTAHYLLLKWTHLYIE